jgi:hypothetical protein
VFGSRQPVVWLQPSTASRTLTFALDRDVAPSLIDIRNTGTGDILLNGTIENPIGTTSIVNTGGSVLSTDARGVLHMDFGVNRESLVRTNVLNLQATAAGKDVGSSAPDDHRINVDVVDAALLPEPMRFETRSVNNVADSIFLGVANLFYQGQLVRYETSSDTPITGLTNGGYYYVIARADGRSVRLASSAADAAAGTAIDIAQAGGLFNSHNLTPMTRFSVLAGNDIALDVLGRQRGLTDAYTVTIDAVDAGGDVDILLRESIRQSTVGTKGGVIVKHPSDANGDSTTLPVDERNPFFNFFTPNTGSPGTLSAGAYATGDTRIDSTYDFRALDTGGNPILPGVVAGGNIIIAAADSSPTASLIHVVGITEILGDGDIDVLTNGQITLAERTGDMRVGRIQSTGHDVLLYSTEQIVDARQDSLPTAADVIARNITFVAGIDVLVAGVDLVDLTVDDPIPSLAVGTETGGIGTPDNFLEIQVNALGGSGSTLGVLRAFDHTATSTEGIYLDQVAGDLHVHTVDSIGDVALRTTAGSILDSRNDGDGDDEANVLARSVFLDANGEGANIGADGNDLEIDSGRGPDGGAGYVGLEATGDIFLTETAGALRLLLAHTYTGDIRLTVRDSDEMGEDLGLLASGTVRFAESTSTVPGNHPDAPREVPRGQIFAEQGTVLLLVGDDVLLDANSEIIAAGSIDIYGDVSATNGVIDPFANADPGWGTNMVQRGRIIAGADVTPGSPMGGQPVGTAVPTFTAPQYLTQIWGNTDTDTFQFGDPSGVGGGTNQGDPGFVFLGSKTRVRGSQSPDASAAEAGASEDRFVVYYLQDAAVTTGPATGVVDSATGNSVPIIAEHTLTLDGQAGSDTYEIYVLGSQGPDPRNYLINVLDTGAPDDGVDELFIYGYDAPDSGVDPVSGQPYPVDDIFLLRAARFIPNETADRPAYVALLHGRLGRVPRYDRGERGFPAGPADQLRPGDQRAADRSWPGRQRCVLLG